MNSSLRMGGVVFSCSRVRVDELVAWAAVSIVLVFIAMAFDAAPRGDVVYYLSMLRGFAENGSPEISEDVRKYVFDRMGVMPGPGGIVAITRDGHLYAGHFWFYSLLNVPAYFILDFFDADLLKSFQLTNALIISGGFFYLFFLSNQKSAVRWGLAAIFILSTGSIYFQWTHPEVFSSVFLLVSALLFIDRRYAAASIMASISSLQNPSIALFVCPIFIGQLLDVSSGKIKNLFTFLSFRKLSLTVLGAVISLVPYVWSYIKFGYPSPIAHLGYVDYSLMSFFRLNSFVFDLNMGLIVGLPSLLWMIPFAVAFRIFESFRSGGKYFFKREDFLLIGFLLIAIPTFVQLNWNPGTSVFSRYASWAGMLPLVWSVLIICRQKSWMMSIGLIPAVVVQAAMTMHVGGTAVDRHGSYVSFQPWVPYIWIESPHFYNPAPEIFYERLVHREEKPVTPAVFSHGGVFYKVLTKKNNFDDASSELCGSGALKAIDQRSSSQPKFSAVELGFNYISGRMHCVSKMPKNFVFDNSSKDSVRMDGWSHPEKEGTWSLGYNSKISLPIIIDSGSVASIKIAGFAFVTSLHPEQAVSVKINGDVYDSFLVSYPNQNFERVIILGRNFKDNDGILSLEFSTPQAISPLKLGISHDPRVLGVSINSIFINSLR